MALHAGARGTMSLRDALTGHAVANAETRAVQAAALASQLGVEIPPLGEPRRRSRTAGSAPHLDASTVAAMRSRELDRTIAYLQGLRGNDQDMADPQIQELVRQVTGGSPGVVQGAVANHLGQEIRASWRYRIDGHGHRM
jgi:hypothetical protein